MLSSVLHVIFRQLKQSLFKNRFIFKLLNGTVLFCCIVLYSVGKSTVAENLGKMEKATGVKTLSVHSLARKVTTALDLHVFSLYRI